MSKPKQKPGLVPAKAKDESIGLADQTNQKFYKMDNFFMLAWQLCDGVKSEEEVAKAFAKKIKEYVSKSKEMKKDSEVKEELLIEDGKKIVEQLKKFGLIE